MDSNMDREVDGEEVDRGVDVGLVLLVLFTGWVWAWVSRRRLRRVQGL